MADSSTFPTRTVSDVSFTPGISQVLRSLRRGPRVDGPGPDAAGEGGYLLVVEGGVPTALGGNACLAWTLNGQDVTFQTAVTDLASKAAKIVAVDTCAAWGGIPAAPPNPAGTKSVSAVVGKPTLNIGGCPPHPDWIVYTLVQLLLGNAIPLDSQGRPTALFGSTVHSHCPRRDWSDDGPFAATFNPNGWRSARWPGCGSTATTAAGCRPWTGTRRGRRRRRRSPTRGAAGSTARTSVRLTLMAMTTTTVRKDIATRLAKTSPDESHRG